MRARRSLHTDESDRVVGWTFVLVQGLAIAAIVGAAIALVAAR